MYYSLMEKSKNANCLVALTCYRQIVVILTLVSPLEHTYISVDGERALRLLHSYHIPLSVHTLVNVGVRLEEGIVRDWHSLDQIILSSCQ